MRTICLLTDFGPKGQHYVASMKAVILNINDEINIMDLSHEITPFSIIEASYVLNATYKLFPENTIFIIVVDPGVGSNREILAFRTKNHYFVGPNNGIFSRFKKKGKIMECVAVKNSKFFKEPVSKTFHGRDIMAPVGAHISAGISINEFGPRFAPSKIVSTSDIHEVSEEEEIMEGIIQYIDSFGNGVTNIPIRNNFIKGSSLCVKDGIPLMVQINNKEERGVFTTHFDASNKGALLFLKGSTNFLEISKNQGNAASELGFKVGDSIKITFLES